MDEQLKHRVLMTILVFNLIIIAYQLILNGGMFGNEFTWLKLFIGLGVAGIGAAVTYVVVQKTQN